MKIELEKGTDSLLFEVADEKVISVLKGHKVPPMDHVKIHNMIHKKISRFLPKDAVNKKIAVLIPDDTRLWARGDLFVPDIIRSLSLEGVPFENITVIIALGTHKDMPEAKFSILAGEYTAENVKIINSAGLKPDRLIEIGITEKGTPLLVTKEAWEANHIIIFGGILHHMLAGFGGGRKYILPGIAGEVSIRHNHSLGMTEKGEPHPMVKQASLKGNPVNEDIEDGARIFLKNKTSCYVSVAANGEGEIFHAEVGDVFKVFEKGCAKLNQACCVFVDKKADFVLFSAGGYRTDGELYQSTKALFNAVNVVKEGGKLLFTAGCRDGAGNQLFADTLVKYRNNSDKLGIALTKDFYMPSYVALRLIDLLNRFDITLLSDLDGNSTRRFGFNYSPDIQDYIDNLDGVGYIIPYAENILPLLKEDGESELKG